MATTEERDVPELQDLVAEIDRIGAQLDQRPAGSIDAVAEIKNTLLPLMKDLAESVMLGLVELQDIVDPIKLTGADAQEIGTLLAALRESQPNNPQLLERIDGALELLSDADDEEGDEDEEEDSN